MLPRRDVILSWLAAPLALLFPRTAKSDLQFPLDKLELMTGRTSALESIGFDYKDQIRRLKEEEQFQAEQQAKLQAEIDAQQSPDAVTHRIAYVERVITLHADGTGTTYSDPYVTIEVHWGGVHWDGCKLHLGTIDQCDVALASLEELRRDIATRLGRPVLGDDAYDPPALQRIRNQVVLHQSSLRFCHTMHGQQLQQQLREAIAADHVIPFRVLKSGS